MKTASRVLCLHRVVRRPIAMCATGKADDGMKNLKTSGIGATTAMRRTSITSKQERCERNKRAKQVRLPVSSLGGTTANRRSFGCGEANQEMKQQRHGRRFSFRYDEQRIQLRRADLAQVPGPDILCNKLKSLINNFLDVDMIHIGA